MKDVIIFDLDGTIALCDHRRHLVAENKWDEFYEACVDDVPNTPVIDMLKHLSHTFAICIFSGRSDLVAKETVAWLKKYEVPFLHLLMRKQGDYTPDEELKKSWLYGDPDFKARVFCIFDDRQKVVDMWRAEGLTCFQVAPGDF